MIHPTAEVSGNAQLGENVKVWHHSQIREGAKIGNNCIIAKNVYIDKDVEIGNNCKIQNNCSIYHGTTLDNGVFVGPHVVFTNDLYPRAITKEGKLKTDSEWEVGTVLVREGASIGARAVILPNVVIGKFALVGAGSVVTKDVPNYGLVLGVPAKLVGFVCSCGRRLKEGKEAGMDCGECYR